MITIIDYGAGNLKSIENILLNLEQEYKITESPSDLAKAEKIIFPGQGHFGQSMNSIKAKGLDKAIIRAITEGIPFLGICVGMQVLFEGSEEAPGIEGLGVFKGKCLKFREGKTPQIGWNKLRITGKNSFLSDDYYYFVNSFYVEPEDKKIISSYTSYHIDFASSVEYKNVAAVQFHPEKSGTVGFNSIKRWLNL